MGSLYSLHFSNDEMICVYFLKTFSIELTLSCSESHTLTTEMDFDKKYVIGLDVGTSGVKVHPFDRLFCSFN